MLTSKGPVVIDTPQLPTKAVEMRDAVEEHGPIQYLVNTEHHVDHIFGNYWFKGRTTIVHHQGVHERFMTVFPELDPFAYALEALPTDDPDGAALVPEREAYYAGMDRADIVFTGDVTLQGRRPDVPPAPHAGPHAGPGRGVRARGAARRSPATRSSPSARRG